MQASPIASTVARLSFDELAPDPSPHDMSAPSLLAAPNGSPQASGEGGESQGGAGRQAPPSHQGTSAAGRKDGLEPPRLVDVAFQRGTAPFSAAGESLNPAPGLPSRQRFFSPTRGRLMGAMGSFGVAGNGLKSVPPRMSGKACCRAEGDGMRLREESAV